MPIKNSAPNFLNRSKSFSDYLCDDVLDHLPEYATIAKLADESNGLLKPLIYDVFETSNAKNRDYQLPLLGISFGCEASDAPAITFVGGIHGIERIGSHVLLSYLHTLVHRASWDESFIQLLNKVRFNFLPIMNPVGMLLGTRANGNGVDLMRNAPIDSKEKVPWLIGGQRFSRHLPWYRGQGELERENKFLVGFLKQDCLHRPFNLIVDCHSGFGAKDRLWIPYAYRKRPPRTVANYFALFQLWQQTYPHNNYIFEPQSRHYITHGDLWDHVGKIVKHQFEPSFLSLTLEMGSWGWIKKSPKQMFSYQGLFNPGVQHRWTRVQRSHLVLFDFLTKATLNYTNWLPTDNNKNSLRKEAIKHWYSTK